METTSDVRCGADVAMATVRIIQKDVENWRAKGIAFEHVGFSISLETLRKKSFRNRLIDVTKAVQPQRMSFLLQLGEAENFAGIDDDLIPEMRYLRSEGVRIALNNFGSGYASLTALLTLSPQVLKIDSLFIDRMISDWGTRSILDEIVAIAARMDIAVIAKGLESDRQIHDLLKSGCRLGQGPLFGGPMTASLLLHTLGPKHSIPSLVGPGAPTIVPEESDAQRSARGHEVG